MERPQGRRETTRGATPTIVRAKVRAPLVRWLPRDRLVRRLDDVWQHPLTLVVAPAGSGKTTLLAEWSAAAAHDGALVAWYRAEAADGDATVALGYLRAAVAEALTGAGEAPGSLGDAWLDLESAVAGLERRGSRRRLLLAIDDLHALVGTPAEAIVERLVDYLPPAVHVVAGTRVLPSFDVSRRLVSGGCLQVTADDLRFRPWEIEGLFRDFYGDVLRPDEVSRLARRTEGWAAGLQLYHLATQDRPVGERLRVLDGLGHGPALVREYLARNVLDALPDELRRFLADTSVLRRVSASLCDELTGRSDSRRLLDELERRQVFTVRVDETGIFRYHEVLRAHLEGVLVDIRGEEGARRWTLRAAELLERDGAVAEALGAYCRAAAWDEVARLLGSGDDRLSSGGSWLDAVPAGMLRQDPWLMLASARRLRSDGRWLQAIQMYRQAETMLGAADAVDRARSERLALAAFLEPSPPNVPGWPGLLRGAIGATRRDGDRLAVLDAVGADSASPRAFGMRLAAGIAELAAGRVREVPPLLAPVLDEAPVASPIAASAWLALGLSRVLSGDAEGLADLEAGIAAADAAAETWLARAGRAALVLAGTARDARAWADLRSFRTTASRQGDPWGEALGALLEAWAWLDSTQDTGASVSPAPLPDDIVSALDAAASWARRMGATAVEAWARGLAALVAVRGGVEGAWTAVLAAERVAREAGVLGARYPALIALATADPERADEILGTAESIRRRAGLRPFRSPGERAGASGRTRDVAPPRDASPGAGPLPLEVQRVPAPLDVRLFGAFAISLRGRPAPMPGLKPRPRAVLRLLLAHCGRPVHREALAAAFWPEVGPEAASRNLNVALSALRRELAEAGGDDLLVRDGDAYRVVIPDGSHVDLLDLESAVREGRAARTRGAGQEAVRLFRRALDLYRGELLPEDGPAEWAVERRDDVRRDLTEAARNLAELLLAVDPEEAARACEAGLAVDPYHDPLWRALIQARAEAGNHAAAEAARRDYQRMLARLGLEAGAADPGGPGSEREGRSRPGRAASAVAVTGGPGTRPR